MNLNKNSNLTARNSKRNLKDSINNKDNFASYKSLINNNDINNYKKDKNNIEIKKIDKYSKENKENKESKESNMNKFVNKIKKEKEKREAVDNNKLKDNKRQFIKKTKNANSVNNIFNNIIIFGSNNKYISGNNTKSYVNNEKKKTNENQNQNHNNKELTIIDEIEKKYETNTNDNCNIFINNKDKKNNNLNENNKLYVYKVNNLNNNNYDIQSQNKKIINKTNNIEKEGRNEKIKDIGAFLIMKKLEKKEGSKKYKKAKNLEKINQTEKFQDNRIFKIEKMTFMKSSFNKNLKKKKLVKNSSKYSKKHRKINLTSERNTYNTICLKEPNKQKLSNNNTKKKYMNCQNINKILNNNKHSKINIYLEFRPEKENSKSENKKRVEITLKNKANFLTIDLDLFSKSKVGTPVYQKISLLGSFRADSKDKKSENMNKIQLSKLNNNSPNYMIRLKRKLIDNKRKLNYKGPKSSFNEYINNKLVKKPTYYFNNVINYSEFHKNKNTFSTSSYKLKHSSTNKSITKNYIKTMV